MLNPFKNQSLMVMDAAFRKLETWENFRKLIPTHISISRRQEEGGGTASKPRAPLLHF